MVGQMGPTQGTMHVSGRVVQIAQDKGQIWEEMGRRNVTYRENTAIQQTAEPIELPFGVGSRNRVSDGRAR